MDGLHFRLEICAIQLTRKGCTKHSVAITYCNTSPLCFVPSRSTRVFQDHRVSDDVHSSALVNEHELALRKLTFFEQER